MAQFRKAVKEVSPKTLIMLSEIPSCPDNDKYSCKNEAILDFAEEASCSTIRHRICKDRYWEEDNMNITYQGAAEMALTLKTEINHVLKDQGMILYF